MTLEASQTWVAPGDSITLTWKLEGAEDWSADMFTGVELNLSLPSGFNPQGVEAGDYDPISNTLRTEIADDKGYIALKVEEDAKWPYILTGRITQTEKIS
jgi:hypothetical protein